MMLENSFLALVDTLKDFKAAAQVTVIPLGSIRVLELEESDSEVSWEELEVYTLEVSVRSSLQ